MSTPLSIVLPVYNAEATLGDQVQDLFDLVADLTTQFEILFSLTLRSHERTLTGEEADQIRDDVVQA
ncbi:MAG TPA: hypothetical protein EYN70_05940, partial [Planctomycetaceae bacterium]|nr:hypothetical protein [Planctomycetaceae bacterium]